MSHSFAIAVASVVLLAGCGSGGEQSGHQTENGTEDSAEAGVEEPIAIEPAEPSPPVGDDGAGGEDSDDQAGDDPPPATEPRPEDGGAAEQENGEGPAIIPARFRGEWNSDRTACGSVSETRLIVARNRLRFYESSGAVQEVRREGRRGISVTAAYEGEGERRTETRRLDLSPNGNRLTVSGRGSTLTRFRCP